MANQDFEMQQGATFRHVIRWKENGENVDLTDYTAAMQIRIRHTSDDAIVSLDDDGNGITLGGAEGTITIVIDSSVTTDIEPRNYMYDLELTDDSGYVFRLLEGRITVTPEVTRAAP